MDPRFLLAFCCLLAMGSDLTQLVPLQNKLQRNNNVKPKALKKTQQGVIALSDLKTIERL